VTAVIAVHFQVKKRHYTTPPRAFPGPPHMTARPQKKQPRKILVTSALPYANGPLHIGHMLEYIQSDIWARFQRLRGHEIYHVCADDAHGTPIMLRARDDGVTPEALIARMEKEHRDDYRDFGISFDNYHSTHSGENRAIAEGIFAALQDGGHIARREIEQSYDAAEKIFLPDRFIKGECPRCGAAEQYGDNCENCGSTYTPAELRNPVSVISGSAPVLKSSEHYFFRLSNFSEFLKEWVGGGHLQEDARNKVSEWFADGLRDWDISRDAPYFGFTIPGESGKYFYVWLDAPIGYMASFKNLCDKKGLDFDEFWRAGSEAELYHFIGKDILYFHALFWPAMLHGANYRKPSALFAHGFLTVDGQKMSKSRGTFIMARTYLNHLAPDYLRYYFAAKLNHRVEDLDLNLEDFVRRVNSDLVGKVVNIASRSAGFVHQNFGGKLGGKLDDETLFTEFTAAAGTVAEHFEQRRYSRAVRVIMDLADRANRYWSAARPWELAGAIGEGEGGGGAREKLLAVCTQSLNMFRILAGFLAPVTPALAQRAGDFLRVNLSAAGGWGDLQTPLLNHGIAPFTPLLARIDHRQVCNIVNDSRDAAAASGTATTASAHEPLAAAIGMDEFAKVDLRVAHILKAEAVEGADKLLRLTVDLGFETRTVFAGIKSAYAPADLEGRLTVVAANLAPRKMRFGVSEGMVLAAGPGGGDIWLLSADAGAPPGSRVK